MAAGERCPLLAAQPTLLMDADQSATRPEETNSASGPRHGGHQGDWPYWSLSYLNLCSPLPRARQQPEGDGGKQQRDTARLGTGWVTTAP